MRKPLSLIAGRRVKEEGEEGEEGEEEEEEKKKKKKKKRGLTDFRI